MTLVILVIVFDFFKGGAFYVRSQALSIEFINLWQQVKSALIHCF